MLKSLCLSAFAAVLLSGCATNRTATVEQNYPQQDYSAQNPAQQQQTVSQLAGRYKANPRDKATIINYAAALREAGQPAQAVSVLESALMASPNDPDIKVNYAKALAATGRYDQALNVVTDAIRPDVPDWNALLVRGAILDQTGRNEEARATYSQALLVAPNQASIEGNLGLSYAMSDDLVSAEQHLRKAASMPGATSRIRQNLALVVGLEGRFDEAQKLYAAELPPEEVAANMAYLKSLMTQQNRWAAIRGGSQG